MSVSPLSQGTPSAEDKSKIDHRHPEVQEDLLKWGNWILEVCHPSTVRHWPGMLNIPRYRRRAQLGFDSTQSSITIGGFCSHGYVGSTDLTYHPSDNSGNGLQIQTVRARSGNDRLFCVGESQSLPLLLETARPDRITSGILVCRVSTMSAGEIQALTAFKP